MLLTSASPVPSTITNICPVTPAGRLTATGPGTVSFVATRQSVADATVTGVERATRAPTFWLDVPCAF